MDTTNSANDPDRPYWYRQQSRQPLFPDIVWSRPVTQQTAGKLLIVGGNSHSFAAVAEAFNAAKSAGAGTIQILLPDSLQKTVSAFLPSAIFSASSPSGGLSRESLAALIEASHWADAVLMAGDLGRNAETAIVLEQYLQKYDGPLCLTGDSLDFFISNPRSIIDRPNTVLAPSFSQLQKLSAKFQVATAFTTEMGLVLLVEQLHQLSQNHPANWLIEYLSNLVVASGGKVSTTRIKDKKSLTNFSATVSVWWLQNPTSTFQALTASLTGS